MNVVEFFLREANPALTTLIDMTTDFPKDTGKQTFGNDTGAFID